MTSPKSSIRVALVVPHVFLHRDILPNVIFSPGVLALELANGLGGCDIDLTLFTPGPVDTTAKNINADMSYFENELTNRNDSYLDLLKKHPFVFVSLARQVQSEIIAKAFDAANNDEYDIVHIYTNEEDIALPFAKLCKKPVVFTHHDPFNFLIRYKSVFPKYPYLNWLSLSLAQRSNMPSGTNWVGNIYHGVNSKSYNFFNDNYKRDYVAYLGRIIEPKGLHLAIDAVCKYNKTAIKPLTLKIAGKHYSGSNNDDYWQQQILPRLGENIEYVDFIKDVKQKNEFLGHAKALIIPSIFDEPFGLVLIEALASGTPVIGLDSGAIHEIINDNNGVLVKKSTDESKTVADLCKAIKDINRISRTDCRKDFEKRFTLDRMIKQHANLYKKMAK